MKKLLIALTSILLLPAISFCQKKVFKYYPSIYYEQTKSDEKWSEWKEATTEFIKSNLIVTDLDNNKINMYSEKGIKEFTLVKVINSVDNNELFRAGWVCIDQDNKECTLMLQFNFTGDKQCFMYIAYPSIKMKFVLRQA